jgi:cytochrome c-type biogenesis protein
LSYDLIGVFGAGLLTFMTPCVLPLVPIYLSALVGADIRKLDASRRGYLVMRAGLFSVGFILVFVLLGLSASSLGLFLAAHKTLLQAVGAVLILIFGLKFMGLLRIAWLDRVVSANDSKLQTRFAWLNAIIMGVVFAAGWSPCIGPVLGSVLTYTASATSNPWLGATYLAAYGAGFAVPLLLVAVFAEAGVRLLGRIKRHLHKIEMAIGVLLVIVAGSMLLDLAGKSPASSMGSNVAEQNNLVESDYPTMLVFTSSNCKICKRMHPIVENITQQCQGNKVAIKEIDLAQASNRSLISDFHLVGTPTFVFVSRKGFEVARLVGEQTEQTLKQALSALRGEPCPGIGQLTTLPDGEHTDISFPEQNSKSTGHSACKTSEQPTDTSDKNCQR